MREIAEIFNILPEGYQEVGKFRTEIAALDSALRVDFFRVPNSPLPPFGKIILLPVKILHELEGQRAEPKILFARLECESVPVIPGEPFLENISDINRVDGIALALRKLWIPFIVVPKFIRDSTRLWITYSIYRITSDDLKQGKSTARHQAKTAGKVRKTLRKT